MKLSLPKHKIKVLLLENIHVQAVNVFQKEGYSVEVIDRALSEEELIQIISDISILGIRSKTSITETTLNSAKRLIAIGAFCIGTNHIDLQSSAQKGIATFHAPYSNTRSVVELVLGAIISLMRGTFDKSLNLHKGIWSKTAKSSYEIRGKKLGIIGYGNIGSQLSIVAEALGMQVGYYDIQEKLTLGNAQKYDSLDELLKESDIVTIHVDGRQENKNLIGLKELRQMPKGSYLINMSRGHVVDIEALCAGLKAEHIMGAAIDVYPSEPKSNDEKFVTCLQNLANVILTPHIAGSTQEAQENIASFVPQRIISYINQGNTMMSVNIPKLQLPRFFGAHRLIHMHKNVPGMLAHINTVLAREHINVLGQYLQTNEHIGYVITDINTEHSKHIVEKLRQIPNTIRVRILY